MMTFRTSSKIKNAKRKEFKRGVSSSLRGARAKTSNNKVQGGLKKRKERTEKAKLNDLRLGLD